MLPDLFCIAFRHRPSGYRPWAIGLGYLASKARMQFAAAIRTQQRSQNITLIRPLPFGNALVILMTVHDDNDSTGYGSRKVTI
ncbi:MAG TPA: hypothetical protein VGM92_06540 [Candidatus Kapabacteria bacterium]